MQAEANEGATGIVKQRMDAMSVMARAMKKVADELIRHATEIPPLFPDNDHSRNGRTEALPSVWARWPQFEALAGRLRSVDYALKAAAESGDRGAITRQFTATAKVCRDCHSDFRKPKD